MSDSRRSLSKLLAASIAASLLCFAVFFVLALLGAFIAPADLAVLTPMRTDFHWDLESLVMLVEGTNYLLFFVLLSLLTLFLSLPLRVYWVRCIALRSALSPPPYFEALFRSVGAYALCTLLSLLTLGATLALHALVMELIPVQPANTDFLIRLALSFSTLLALVWSLCALDIVVVQGATTRAVVGLSTLRQAVFEAVRRFPQYALFLFLTLLFSWLRNTAFSGVSPWLELFWVVLLTLVSFLVRGVWLASLVLPVTDSR